MSKPTRTIRVAAMDYLSRREHSSHELFQKLLAKKEYEFDDISEELTHLSIQGLLSDERFTENFISLRMKQGKGPLKIHAELRQKGVSDAMIGKFLDERDTLWQESALAARIKKFGKESPTDLKETLRQRRFLQSRGFSSEQTRYAMADNDHVYD